jgi:hypothetical protein
MNEGLVGFIIMIIVLNFGARILKALASKQQPRPKGPGAPGASPPPQQRTEPEGRRTVEASVETRAPDMRVEERAAGTGDEFPYEDGEAPGEFARWREDRFEEEGDLLSYLQSLSERPARIRKPKKQKAAKPVAEPAVKPAERIPGVRPSKAEVDPYLIRKRGTASRDLSAFVQSDLGDTASLRKAIVLSTILGPCRAMKRRIR